MESFSTPMMKQYLELKKQYQDCLLFFRLGDFYELFMEDAHTGARVLNITLTARPRGKDGRIPMAGVPYHAVDTYLAKLVKAGYKVAICEQVSLPNKYGLVDREVVRVVTPGTVLDENALDKKQNNFIVGLSIDGSSLAIAASDISTGYFAVKEVQFDELEQSLRDELSKIHPVECILPDNLYNNPEILKLLKSINGLNIYPFNEWTEYSDDGKKYLKEHFQLSTLAGFDLEDKLLACEVSAALLGYLKQTQKSSVSHIKKITLFKDEDHVLLDRSTVINLELFSTIREHDVRGSLINTIDQTITAMGGRMLKDWLGKPLMKKQAIEKRLDAVETFYHNASLRDDLRENLKSVPDIERVLSRLAVGLGNARDLINLKEALSTIIRIKGLMEALVISSDSEKSADNRQAQSGDFSTASRNDNVDMRSKNEKINLLEVGKNNLINNIYQQISPDLAQIIRLIEQNITEEPPIDLKIGGLIKSGVEEKLDTLRGRVQNSKEWITELEKTEREKTGISSLKVRFNRVFGFYIEISKSNLDQVPENYLRKQTLVNGERFITPELKKHEEIILTAQEKINDLEYQLFLEILQKVLSFTGVIQQSAEAIATLDCILNFSFLAEKNQYIRPKFVYSDEIKIKQGRHPVVEKLLDDTQFVPNDVILDKKNGQLLLITGPNMAGKSVLIRQVALIVLMAQLGMYVPAESAQISLVDRIFVRSGASDVITSGLSTFMVEMVETAYILNHATSKSLIVMDEIGRGTSTYDGISIAWAIAEFLVTHFKIPPKTLFATHYHELQKLEEKFPKNIKNYSMAVTESQGEPIFLHTIIPGGASSSFGVAVAKLAGVPYPVIKRAQEKLGQLELNNPVILNGVKDISTDNTPTLYPSAAPQDDSIHGVSNETILEHILVKELDSLDISNMTPLEALNKLAEIKSKIKIVQSSTKEFVEVN
jgi:DNA mismatch repair protein MutS